MSSVFRGQAVNAPGARAERYPLASVSRRALARNVAATQATTYSRSLLRGDAWGHGEATILAVLEQAGLTPEEPARIAPSAATRDGSLSPDELYGLSGTPNTIPAMQLKGIVLATKELREGEGVSYGYLFRAAADTRIALVTGGYAQGVVRSLGGVAQVTVGRRRHPIIGRVAMDACVIEIADAAVRRGDEAVFFGDPGEGEPPLAEWGAATRLSTAELVTAVGLHANRRVLA